MARLALLIPFLAGAGLGLLAVPGDFVFDDVPIVERNERLDHVSAIPGLFLDSYWGDYAQGGIYRPLTLAGFAVERALFGRESAVGFHVTNALLYGLCAALLARLAATLGLSPATAGAAGVLFAAHPIHVEAVAPLVGRSELAAGCFVLVALGSSARREPGWRAALIASAALLCALFSKETGLAAVPALLILPFVRESLAAHASGGAPTWRDLLRGGVRSAAAQWRTGLGIAAAIAVWATLRSIALDRPLDEVGILDNVLSERGSLGRIAGALEVSLRYFRMTLWPWPLCADHSYPAIVPSARLLSPLPLLGLAGWLAIGTGIALGLRRAPRASLGLGIYAAALFPVSNLAFPIGTIFAERLLFLPSLGACLVLGSAFAAALRRSRQSDRIARVLLIAAVVLGVTGFAIRVADWRDEETLALSIVRVQPRSAKGHGKYGWELCRRVLDDPAGAEREAALDRAEWHLVHSIELCPEFGDSHRNLAILLDQRGRTEEAVEHARRARDLEPWKYEPHLVLARLLIRLERHGEAFEACERALGHYAAGFPGLRELRGLSLAGLGRPIEAASEFARAYEEAPALRLKHLELRSLAEGGAFDRAEAVLDALIAEAADADADPALLAELPAFLSNRGLLRAGRGEHLRAIEDFDRALAVAPEFSKARGNRVRSLVALGRLEEAGADLAILETQVGTEAARPLRELWEAAREGE